jgi:asparagine synthase (glutamine-hydrolysing)
MQPHISSLGAVITWDGRLDNRPDLISKLSDTLTADSMDVAIVAAAYEKWGTDCFGKLIGDWALSLWNPNNRSLLLAKDVIGPRHLYYLIENNQITWSTLLDPIVLLAGKSFAICEEYAAGWLSHFPATHLTPYVGIHAVPPSSFVLLRPGKHIVSKYWDFDPAKKIRYRSDAAYEEHFRTVFANAVQRRLRSDTPILAELSGGRDSCSIVCMADAIIGNAAVDTPRLDTVSYYDDSEPNGNEQPYFSRVEAKRGRTGLHINISPEQKTYSKASCEFDSRDSPVIPSYTRRLPEFGNWLISRGNRVVISGSGGDEVMGGVPVPTPELQDHIARARLRPLAHQLKAWALHKRKPWFQLFFEAVRGFVPPPLVGVPEYMRPARWLQSKFVKCHWAALTGYPSRVKLLGPTPTFQDDMSSLNYLRRQLACKATPADPIYEMRYPYLDRDLLEFMFAIPREQSVRPTQRRSLMRRALVGFVPEEILNRQRKCLAVRAPLVQIRNDWPNLVFMTQHMLSSSLGIVDSERFLAALQKGKRGEVVPIVGILRMTLFEGWLRNIRALGILDADASGRPRMAVQSSA